MRRRKSDPDPQVTVSSAMSSSSVQERKQITNNSSSLKDEGAAHLQQPQQDAKLSSSSLNTRVPSTLTSSSSAKTQIAVVAKVFATRASRYLLTMSTRRSIVFCLGAAFLFSIMIRVSPLAQVGGSSSSSSSASSPMMMKHGQDRQQFMHASNQFRGGGDQMNTMMASDMAMPMMAESAPAMMAPPPMPMMDASVEGDFGGGGERGGGGGGGGGNSGATRMRSASKMGKVSVGQAITNMNGIPASTKASEGALEGPVILKSGSLSAEVLDVAPVMETLRILIEKELGGFVESSSTSTDEWLLRRWKDYKINLEHRNNNNNNNNNAAGATAAAAVLHTPPEGGATNGYLQVRIPSDKFDSACAKIREKVGSFEGDSSGGPGRISNENTQGVDVTESYVDVVTRQGVDEHALAQMEELMTAATTVDEVLSIQREMNNIASRLEVLKAQRASMEGRSRMSSLSININVPQPPQLAPPPPPQPKGWSIGGVFGNAFSALGSTAQMVLEILIFTLVFGIPIAILGFLARKIILSTAFGKSLLLAGGSADGGGGGAAATAGDYNLMR